MDKPPTPTDDGLTVREAAKLVGRREYDIRDAIATGTLPHTTRILVSPTDIKAWASGGRS